MSSLTQSRYSLVDCFLTWYHVVGAIVIGSVGDIKGAHFELPCLC